MEILNARHEIRAIFQERSCAFDTVWHPALLTKLSSYGIQGNLHSWLVDFLSYQSQRVGLHGVLSSPLPVQAGVPQGGVLGPAFFLVFINIKISDLDFANDAPQLDLSNILTRIQSTQVLKSVGASTHP